jgi:hypothetical protein
VSEAAGKTVQDGIVTAVLHRVTVPEISVPRNYWQYLGRS